MENNEQLKQDKKFYYRILIGGIFSYIGIVAIFFLLAWRIDYWQAWIYGITGFFIIIAAGIAFRNRPELIKERAKPGPGTKKWDKILWTLFTPFMFLVMVIAALDTGRFGWTSQLFTPEWLEFINKIFSWTIDLPWYVYIISYIVYFYSHFLKYWCMWTNKFFSSTVRIQLDRDQVVIQDGPYRFIRHPGYTSAILASYSLSLILGSIWGLIPAGIVMILLIIRTYLEDKTLKEELPGYADYTKKVRFRLIPGIW